MKKLLAVLVMIILVIGVFAENGVTDNKITIGTFQALSGPFAAIGQSMTNGMKAYFNHINDNGGINGRKIDLIAADDQFNPAKTTIEVKRMVEEDKVFAVVGGLGTPGCLAVMDYLNNLKVPFVYQGSGASQLAIPPKKYIFPVQPNYTVEGNIMVRYLVNQKFKRIAIVYRNADDGKEEYNSVVKTLKGYNLKPVAEIAVNPAALDFQTEMTKLVAAQPDAVILMNFLTPAVNFVKQAKQYGLTKQKYLLTYSLADISFINLAGAAVAEGVEAMAWVNIDFTKSDLPALQIYKKYYNAIPNAYAIAGMIAAEIFVEGVKRAGADLDREKLVAALETMNKWSGIVAHEITYKKYNPNDTACRLGKQSMYTLKAQKGVWTTGSKWIGYVH